MVPYNSTELVIIVKVTNRGVGETVPPDPPLGRVGLWRLVVDCGRGLGGGPLDRSSSRITGGGSGV